MNEMKVALRFLIVMTVLTGALYTGGMTLLSQVLFPYQSSGSLIFKEEKILGSSLLAQKFSSERYFWPRPSASDFKAVPSGASNLGPTSLDLKKQVDERAQALKKAHPMEEEREIPSDLLFSSGSGLDPDISPEAADYQFRRIAKARNISVDKLRDLVKKNIQGRQLGFLGEPRVNVLVLNLTLDSLYGVGK